MTAPYEYLHQFLQVCSATMVDRNFDLEEHNEVYKILYPLRKKNQQAADLLEKSCMGHKVTVEQAKEVAG